jgi:hypothetical protein
MSRTLLIGNSAYSWREWLKSNRGARDLICLDPADANLGPPARLTLSKDQRPHRWRFYGSLDPLRSPHIIMAAVAEFLNESSDGLIVQLYAYRATPLLRHLTTLIAQVLQPSEILMPPQTEIEQLGWPVGPEPVEVETAFPELVQNAQRKAQWLKLIESCEEHSVDLRKVSVEGARLGAGTTLLPEIRQRAGIEAAEHAEVCGGNLLIVAADQPEEGALSRALDVTHCTRATVVDPSAYNNLLCSFAHQPGDDFGMGMIRQIDFSKMVATVRCTAVAPAPVRILRLGSLRVDSDGRELGEARPWQV